jgi:hypothetical protein
VRFITLTRAPEGWHETRAAVKVWLRHLRREHYRMNLLWVVEKGEDTGMKHVHAVQWGDFIPKEQLSGSWAHGSTQIEGARAATNYLAKGVVRYVAKNLDGDQASIEAHMNLNGGRAAHWSRAFFDGMSREAYKKANPMPGVYFVETDRPGNLAVPPERVEVEPLPCGCREHSPEVTNAALGRVADTLGGTLLDA